ncbi:MAG TPA: ABC transporter permease [Anaerolineae bacterium]|jgi:putative ABC transport system permease protein|nr:ABC transporter permease [Anaerolineae bacterium]
MNVTENIRIAFRGLAANKLRAALTMLGIMIGVAAVITLMAIGDGVNRFVADQFIGLGTNLVFVVPNEDPFRAEPSISMADAQALADVARVPGVVASAPLYNRSSEVVYGGNVDTVPIQASTPDYGEIRGYEVERGRFFGDTDYNGRSRVVVLGAETVENLYPEDVDPLETDVKIDGINFRVIGILEEQGGGLFGSQDNLLILPLTTAQERLFNARSRRTGELLVDTILLQAVSSEAVQDVVIDATEALRQTHNISFRDEDDFVVLTQEDFLDTFGQVIGVLTLFLGAIAGISLLVGGIGIMNIMLVTVTERTREIGLRKAVGAKRSDILGQFLTEAIILSIVGGLLGIFLGFLGATVIQLAVPDLETSITAGAVTLAVGFSAAVGLFFGIYPASRAAALDPIEALRFE